MNDLQLALLALGAIIIASVILFNWWQERRIHQETVRRFEGPIEDILLKEDFRIDPAAVATVDDAADVAYVSHDSKQTDGFEQTASVADETQGESGTADAEQPMIETESSTVASDQTSEEMEIDVLEATGSKDAEPMPPTAVPVSEIAPVGLPAGGDELIDIVVMIVPTQACSGEALREALLPLPQLDKPSQWLGLDTGGEWRYLAKEQEQHQFVRVAGTLQLADRSGAVSEGTLRNFRLKAEEAASRLRAVLEWHGQTDPQCYAQELDQFCVEVDVMVGLHLVSVRNGPFAGTKLRGLAEAGGMVLAEDGTFHYRNEFGETLFTLVNQEQRPFSPEMLRTALVLGVTLQMDVPRVRNCLEAFNLMVLQARRMEQGLNAKLTDDNRRVLGDTEIEKIRRQLKLIHATMIARSIVPGSPTALRLFS